MAENAVPISPQKRRLVAAGSVPKAVKTLETVARVHAQPGGEVVNLKAVLL